MFSDLLGEKTVRRVRLELGENVPDSGQEHSADGDDGLLVAAASLQAAVAFLELRVLVRVDDSVGNLNEERLEEGAGTRDAGGFDLKAALVVAWTASGPGSEMLGGGEYGHLGADLRDDGNSGHRISGEAGNGPKQAELVRIRFRQPAYFLLNRFFMRLYLVNMGQTFPELHSLLTGDRAVDSGLDLLDGMLTAPVNERSDVELLAGVIQNEVDDGT